MTKRISRIAPLQAGIVYACLMGVASLIAVPFIYLASVIAPRQPGVNGGFLAVSLMMIFIIPIIYIVFGFVIGVVGAAVYNVIAKLTGGIEMTLSDVAPETLPNQTGY